MASQPAKMNNSENHIACIKISTKMIEIKNIIIIIINLKKNHIFSKCDKRNLHLSDQ